MTGGRGLLPPHVTVTPTETRARARRTDPPPGRRAAGAGDGWVRHRHDRVRVDGAAAAARPRGGRVDPGGRPRDLGVRAGRGGGSADDRVPGGAPAAPLAARRADGRVRGGQRRLRPRHVVRRAAGRPVRVGSAPRRLLRHRLPRRGQPGRGRPEGPGGRLGHARAVGGQRPRRPGGHLARPEPGLAFGVLAGRAAGSADRGAGARLRAGLGRRPLARRGGASWPRCGGRRSC